MLVKFSVIFISFVLITVLIGYLISSINIFKTSRLFRIFIYVLVIVIISSICVLLYKDSFNYVGEGNLSGYMSGIHSFWFYIGIRIRKNFRKFNKLYSIKKIIGWLSLLNGVAILLIPEMGMVEEKYSIIDLYICVSYLVFGKVILKKYPNSEDASSLDQKTAFPIKNTQIFKADKTNLNTFFFGYLPLKLRKLIRVFCIFLVVWWLFYLLDEADLAKSNSNPFVFILFPVIIFVIALSSYLIKSFVDKDYE